MQQSQRWCRDCEDNTLFARSQFEFGWGCLLTLASCGLFFPLWVFIGLIDLMRPWRCQKCGATYQGTRDPIDWPALERGLAGAIGHVVVEGWRSVGRVYRSLPDWAAPIVWGLAAAAPVIGVMFAWRAYFAG